MQHHTSCIAPARTQGKADGLVIALRDGIYRVRTWGGRLQRLVLADPDAATTRTNDGKADPRGRFWAGTPVRAARCGQSSAFFNGLPQRSRARA